VSQGQKLCTCGSSLRAFACCTTLENFHAIVSSSALDTGMIDSATAAAEDEAANFTTAHVLVVLDAWDTFSAFFTPGAEDNVLHACHALLEAQLFPFLQQ